MNVFTTNEHPGNTRGKQTRGFRGAVCFSGCKEEFPCFCQRAAELVQDVCKLSWVFTSFLRGKSGYEVISQRVLLLWNGSLCRRSDREEGIKE